MNAACFEQFRDAVEAMMRSGKPSEEVRKALVRYKLAFRLAFTADEIQEACQAYLKIHYHKE